MKEKINKIINNKKIIIPLLILLISLTVVTGTFAWFTWQSTENTSLTMTIGKLVDVVFTSGNDINAELPPVFYYYDGVQTTFSINNKSSNSISYTIKLNIETIDTELTNDESVKYALTKDGEIVAQDTLKGVSDGTSLPIHTDTSTSGITSYVFYLYIDSNMENSSEMMNKTITGSITVEAATMPILAPNSTWYAGTTDKTTITKITLANSYTVTGDETESWAAAGDFDGDGANDSDVMCYLNGTELTIVGNGSGKIYANEDSSYLFSGFTGVTSINNLSMLNTSNVTSMYATFHDMSSLTSIDVSNFDTSSVTTMRGMFNSCSSLISIDLSTFNTNNVTTMYRMFYNCSNLKTIYVSDLWKTSSVTDSTEMFTGCSSLVGGAGTTYNSNYTDITYAKIDGGLNLPGYLTDITLTTVY